MTNSQAVTLALLDFLGRKPTRDELAIASVALAIFDIDPDAQHKEPE